MRADQIAPCVLCVPDDCTDCPKSDFSALVVRLLLPFLLSFSDASRRVLSRPKRERERERIFGDSASPESSIAFRSERDSSRSCGARNSSMGCNSENCQGDLRIKSWREKERDREREKRSLSRSRALLRVTAREEERNRVLGDKRAQVAATVTRQE